MFLNLRMFLEDDFHFGGRNAPYVDTSIGGSHCNILTIGAEGSSGPVAAHFKPIATVIKHQFEILFHAVKTPRPDAVKY